MRRCNIKSLIGKHVVGQHGRQVGIVSDLLVNIESWQLEAIMIELSRESSEDLHLKQKWFGAQIVNLPISEISGVTDSLVLKHSLEEIEFSDRSPMDPELDISKEAAV